MKQQLENYKHIVVIIIITLIGFTIFFNSFHNNFVFDDRPVISENNLIKDLRNAPQIFTTGYWRGGLGQDLGLYRPLTIFSYAINYRFHEFNVVGYHLINIILHILITFLIYLVIIELFSNFMLAIISSLLFLTHPIHTEAVTGLVGRAELLSALFFFLSYLFFVRIRKLENVESVSISHAELVSASLISTSKEIPKQVRNDISLKCRERSRPFPTVLHIIFLCSYFLGLLSKENCLSLIFILPITDIIIFSQASLKNYFTKLKEYLGIYIGLVSATILYLVIRALVLGSFFPKIPVDFLDNQLAYESHFWRIIFSIRILFKYIYLLIFPLTLSPDYSYNQISLQHSLIQIENLIPIILFVLIALFILVSIKKLKFIGFSILFFFLTIFLTSNILFPIGTIMGERLLYLPSFGFCLFLGYLLNPETYKKISQTQDVSNYENENHNLPINKLITINKFSFLLIFSLIIIIFYSFRTYLRNPDWYDDYTLYSSAVKSVSNSSKVHGNLGEVYRRWGLQYSSNKYYSMAIEELNIALKIYPNNSNALNSLGVTYSILKEYDKAIEYLEKSFELKPKADTLFNLGESYYNKGEYKQAVKYFEETIKMNPDDTIAKMRLKMSIDKAIFQ